ncbi:MAG: TIGR02217 family protein [Rickettsiales bacterium]|nr:MAG: TIGR02217 family protein [Rickettsiales bacterium]
MPSFIEAQFPAGISYGSKGGAMFSTDIVSTFSGHEQRNINWHQARARYDVASGVKTPEQWQELIAFFRTRRGRAVGFRYKDWSDYQGVNQHLGTGDGRKTIFQMVKHYVSGDAVYSRIINKPVCNDFCKIYIDSILYEDGINIDFTTGQVEFRGAPRIGEEITADFEFDVAVRFDTDHLDLSMDGFNTGSWQNIPLIEIRV